MKLIGFLIGVCLIFIKPTIICAAPSFDCKKAITTIEKAICEDEVLSDLDRVLNFIYTRIMSLSTNQDLVKKSQLKWLKERSKIKEDFGYFLRKSYEERIFNLVKENNNILPAIIKELLSQDEVDASLLSFILAPSWRDKYPGQDWIDPSLYDWSSACVRHSKFMKINDKKSILLFCYSMGGHSGDYILMALT